jgi:hypothetical protein|tara:strand:- start:362 stop:553 length:192 start_codon:yes stop_codon:yes gene_type:complete
MDKIELEVKVVLNKEIEHLNEIIKKLSMLIENSTLDLASTKIIRNTLIEIEKELPTQSEIIGL